MVKLKRLWSSKPALYGLALILLLLVFSLNQRPPSSVQGFAYSLSDSFYYFNPRTPPVDIVFLEVENTSVRQFGRWPWPRSLIAAGLAKLESAAAIGLDMLFSEATTTAEDHALATTLADLPMVGGLFLNGPSVQQLAPEAWDQLADSALLGSATTGLLASQQIELPTPVLAQAMPILASLNIAPDSDQLFRHYPLAFAVGGLVIPNMSTQLWRLRFNQNISLSPLQASLGKQALTTDAQGRLRLNFYPQQHWQRLSFAQLMQPDFDSASLSGKVVLVGVSEAGITDIRATPIGHIAGPLVHLTMLANWLDGSTLSSVPPYFIVLLMLFSWLLALLIWQLHWPWLRLLCWGLMAASVYALGLWLYLSFSLWLEIFYPLLLILLWLVAGEAWLFRLNRAETMYLRHAFSSYVAPTLVTQLVKQGEALHLGGQKQVLTALFTDLRDFTATSETLATEELVSHLNQYFSLMVHEIHQQQGTLDKFIGDAVMALFNAPLKDEDHAYHACIAAINMMRALAQFNQRFPAGSVQQLRMGIGINTGEAIVGNIGAAGRFNYTAIGDTVNIAARLESATKEVDGDILLGEATYLAVKDRLPCRAVAALQLKGKSQPLPAWILDWQRAP